MLILLSSHIDGGNVTDIVLASSVVYSKFKRQLDKTDYKIIFAASSLHTQRYRVRTAAPLLNIRIMCLSCAACPSMDCCFE